MSEFSCEIRRRLWATILEITVQTSLHAGMPPLISFDDFDCQLPLNVDDSQLSEGMEVPPTAKSPEVYTDTSLQLLLMRSLRTRLEITKSINDLRSDLSYETALKHATDMTSNLRHNATLFKIWSQSTSPTSSQPTIFHTKTVDLLTRRFLLAIHQPFAMRTKANPIFYFSRKTVLDQSLILLSNPSDASGLLDGDYFRLRVLASGLFKSTWLTADMTVALELISQLQEDSSSFGTSTIELQTRKEMFNVLKESQELAAKRIRAGETNVNGYLLLACILGQVEALMEGSKAEERIVDRTKREIEYCYEMLRERYGDVADDGQRDTGGHDETNGSLEEVPWDVLVR
jgi:hypothetical protein